MQGDAADVLRTEFNFSSVNATAHFDAKRGQLLDDCGSAAHAECRTLEGSKKAISNAAQFTPTKANKFLAHDTVVPSQ
jgi:hypothetical protein